MLVFFLSRTALLRFLSLDLLRLSLVDSPAVENVHSTGAEELGMQSMSVANELNNG